MTDLEIVRMKTGDNTVPYIFSDAEVTQFLTESGGSVNLASALLCEAWATRYALNPTSEHIGDYSYTQKITDNLLGMAQRFRDAETKGAPATDWAEFDLANIGEVGSEEV